MFPSYFFNYFFFNQCYDYYDSFLHLNYPGQSGGGGEQGCQISAQILAVYEKNNDSDSIVQVCSLVRKTPSNCFSHLP